MAESSWKRLRGAKKTCSCLCHLDKSRTTCGECCPAKRNKYGAVKVNVDGMRFDSKSEADFYQQLKLRKKAGDILDFKCQVTYELIPAFTDTTGYHHRPLTYRADFVVFGEGYTEIIDVKGFRTREFTLKWKMLKYLYRSMPEYRLTIVNS